MSLDPGPSTLDPKFFTPEEYQTVRALVDLVIPRDGRSGSATDAGVPEFMDFMMADQDTSPEARTAMRGGLAWTDAECRRRFGKRFVDCTQRERIALLDEIAWPARARPEMSHGVAFFNAFRDLTASGFWSSEMGVRDLRYEGNSFVPEWSGCPDAVLRKLDIQYDD
jgi:gluconate 2-dehydrogenase gamma chain